MPSLKSSADGAIYCSVVLGALLLYEAGPLVPSWLLASLAAGELAYAACAVMVALGKGRAYYAVLALAALVLAVSLPQPQHYAFATGGDWGAFLTFAVGSGLQVFLLVAIPVYLVRKRRARGLTSGH